MATGQLRHGGINGEHASEELQVGYPVLERKLFDPRRIRHPSDNRGVPRNEHAAVASPSSYGVLPASCLVHVWVYWPMRTRENR